MTTVEELMALYVALAVMLTILTELQLFQMQLTRSQR